MMTRCALILTPAEHVHLRDLLSAVMDYASYQRDRRDADDAREREAAHAAALDAADALDLLDEGVASMMLLSMPDPDRALRHEGCSPAGVDGCPY